MCVYDVVDALVQEALLESYLSVLDHLEHVGNNAVPIYSHDFNKEQKKVAKLAKSLYNTLDYFSTREQMEGIQKPC